MHGKASVRNGARLCNGVMERWWTGRSSSLVWSIATTLLLAFLGGSAVQAQTQPGTTGFPSGTSIEIPPGHSGGARTGNHTDDLGYGLTTTAKCFIATCSNPLGSGQSSTFIHSWPVNIYRYSTVYSGAWTSIESNGAALLPLDGPSAGAWYSGFPVSRHDFGATCSITAVFSGPAPPATPNATCGPPPPHLPENCGAADPVDCRSRAFYLTAGLEAPGAGLSMDAAIRYSSFDAFVGRSYTGMSPGWTLDQWTLKRRVETALPCNAVWTGCNTPPVYYDLFMPDGAVSTFKAIDAAETQFEKHPTVEMQLSRNAATGVTTLSNRFGDIWTFDTNGMLTSRQDRIGNRLTYAWNNTTGVWLVSNNLNDGRTVRYEHSQATGPNGVYWRLDRIVHNVANAGSRALQLGYNSGGQLVTLTDAAGRVRTFSYISGNRIEKLYDENNDPQTLGAAARATVNVYDGARVVEQQSPSGAITGFEVQYSAVMNPTRVTYGLRSQAQAPRLELHFYNEFGLFRYRKLIGGNYDTPGLHIVHAYNGSGLPIQVIDPAGRYVELGWDAARNMTMYKDAPIPQEFTYDSFGNVLTHKLSSGVVHEFGYDARGVLTNKRVKGTSNTIQSTTYEANTAGQITAVVLPDGTRHTTSYDSLGLPDIYTEAAGTLNLSTDIDYDWRGFVTRIRDERGVITTFQYTQDPATGQYGNAGWPTQIVFNAAGSSLGGSPSITTLRYDAMGNVLTRVDGVGTPSALTTTSTFAMVGAEGKYAPTSVRVSGANTPTQITEIAYNLFGDAERVTEKDVCCAAGSGRVLMDRIRSYRYTDQGRLDKVLDHAGQTILDFEYNPAGDVIQVSDRRGIGQRYEYDHHGRVVFVRRGNVISGGALSVTELRYDTKSNLVKVINPVGAQTDYFYDEFNRVNTVLAMTSQAQGSAVVEETYYSYQTASAATPGFQRNWPTRIQRGSSASAVSAVLEYDRLGRVTQRTLENGSSPLITRFLYTLGSEPDRSNLRQVIDANNATTSWLYNAFGQVVRETDAAGNQWNYDYNERGWLTAQRDPLAIAASARETRYSYDATGRLLSLLRDGKSESWAYDADGALRQKVDFAGRATGFTYDTLGRLRLIDYPPGDANVDGAPDVRYSYDQGAIGNVLEEQLSDTGTVIASSAYEYDNWNRLSRYARTDSLAGHPFANQARRLQYDYTLTDAISRITYPDLSGVDYTMDALSRPATLTPFGGAAQSFSYRRDGALNAIQRVGGPTTTYGYDAAGRVNDANTTSGASTLQRLQVLARDGLGNIQQLRESVPSAGPDMTTSYSYDLLSRLTNQSYPLVPGTQVPGAPSGNRTYGYDPTGNITSITGGNTPPTISNIADLSVVAGSNTGAIAFTVNDTQTPTASLTLQGSSTNTALVPISSIAFGGSGSARTVTVTPVAGQTGQSTIRITVSDGQLTAFDEFVLTVSAGNTPPTISNIADVSIAAGSNTGAIAFTVNDTQTPAASLTLQGTSTNTALVSASGIVFGGSGTARTVTVTPNAGQTGQAVIRVTVSDGQLTAFDEFVLTVGSGSNLCASTPATPVRVAAGQGLFASFSASERLEVRGGRVGTGDWEWGLGANTQLAGQFVNAHLDWVSGRNYRFVLRYNGQGSGTMEVFDGASMVFTRTFAGASGAQLRTGNALQLYAKANAGLGTARVVMVLNRLENGTYSDTLQTAGNNNYSEVRSVYFTPALANGFELEGTIRLEFTGTSAPSSSRLVFTATAGNLNCGGAP